MDAGDVRISGVFSGLIAILALLVSLASAGWSVWAYYKSSEITPLPFEEITFINDDDTVQAAIEISVANLAYGEFDDVARDQVLTLSDGERRLRFVARHTASLRESSVGPDGVPETLEYPCRSAGIGIAACVISESPVTSLPAGGVVTMNPVFELATTDCGVANCRDFLVEQMAEFLAGNVIATYSVETLRDGARSWSCRLDTTQEGLDYYRNVGWYNPPCQAEGL